MSKEANQGLAGQHREAGWLGWARRGLCVLALAGALLPGALRGENAVEGLTARQILLQARMMFPRENFRVVGRLGTAERRGQREVWRPYALELNWAEGVPTAHCRLFRYTLSDETPLLEAKLTRAGGRPQLTLTGSDGAQLADARLNTPIGESDLTWMDLAFDYFWWPEVRTLPEEELEQREIPTRVSGRQTVVLEAVPPEKVSGLAAVRIWIDRGTGNLLQTAQINEAGETVRLMYVQRIGREEGRWVPREFRVKRTGFSRITRLRVTSITSESFVSTEESNDE